MTTQAPTNVRVVETVEMVDGPAGRIVVNSDQIGIYEALGYKVDTEPQTSPGPGRSRAQKAMDRAYIAALAAIPNGTPEEIASAKQDALVAAKKAYETELAAIAREVAEAAAAAKPDDTTEENPDGTPARPRAAAPIQPSDPASLEVNVNDMGGSLESAGESTDENSDESIGS